MKSSIKIKWGSILQKLLDKPIELKTLIQVAFYQDEALGYAEKAILEPDKEALSNLIIWGLVEEVNGKLSIPNKKVIEINLKKKPEKAIKLESRRLQEVSEKEVPANQVEHFKMAIAFHKLFESNLKGIGVRTTQLEKANYGKWVNCIKLMTEQDKVTVDEMREVWGYLKGNTFWASNVQSVLKLRDKFQTIHSQVKTNERRKSEPKSGDTNVSKAYVQRIITDLQS